MKFACSSAQKIGRLSHHTGKTKFIIDCEKHKYLLAFGALHQVLHFFFEISHKWLFFEYAQWKVESRQRKGLYELEGTTFFLCAHLLTSNFLNFRRRKCRTQFLFKVLCLPHSRLPKSHKHTFFGSINSATIFFKPVNSSQNVTSEPIMQHDRDFSSLGTSNAFKSQNLSRIPHYRGINTGTNASSQYNRPYGLDPW